MEPEKVDIDDMESLPNNGNAEFLKSQPLDVATLANLSSSETIATGVPSSLQQVEEVKEKEPPALVDHIKQNYVMDKAPGYQEEERQNVLPLTQHQQELENVLPLTAQQVTSLNPPSLLRQTHHTNHVVQPGAFTVEGIGYYPQLNPNRNNTASVEVNSSGRTLGQQLQPARLLENGLPVANHAADTSTLPVADYLESGRGSNQKKRNDTSLVFGTIGYVLCLVAVILVLVIVGLDRSEELPSINDDDAQQSPTLAPANVPNGTTNFTDLERLVLQMLPIETLQQLKDRASPQSLAYQWILGDLEVNRYTLTTRRLKERFALATLFYASNGPEWLSNKHWLDHSIHECFWWSQEEFFDLPRAEVEQNFSYVKVGHPNPCEIPPSGLNNASLMDVNMVHGHFQHIWLHSNALGGSIPLEFYWLTNLRSISVYNNEDLTGSISSHIGNLSKLESINFGGTSLGGSLPTEIGLLSDSMFSIAIQYAQLEGNLPSQLGLLHKMHDLLLDQNSFHGTLPDELGNASNLEWINWSHNSFTGKIPVSLRNLHQLVDMRFNNNQFSGTIHPEFGQISSLVWFNAYVNYLSGPIPSEFGQTTNLKWLNLWLNHLTGTIPSELGQLFHLKSFEPSSNALTGMIPSEFVNLQQLQYFSLNGNMLSGSIPQGGNFSNLLWLQLTNNSLLTGPLPTTLTSLTGLLLDGTQITGVLPDHLCDINALEFDCNSSVLCGCSCSCTGIN